MEKNYLGLRDLDAYKTGFDLSNHIWDLVMQWENFAKHTVGKQIVNSSDSISANIAEGFGRYHKNDKTRFYRISRGSVLEVFDWIDKAKYRNLISQEEYNHISQELEKLPKQLNYLIKYTNDKLKY